METKLLDLHSTLGSLKSYSDFKKEIKLRPLATRLLDAVHSIDLELHGNECMPKTRLNACNQLVEAIEGLETVWEDLTPPNSSDLSKEWLEKTNTSLRTCREQVQTCLDKYETTLTIRETSVWLYWSWWQMCFTWGGWAIPILLQVPFHCMVVAGIFGSCKLMGGFLPRRLAFRERLEYFILTLLGLLLASNFVCLSTVYTQICTFLETNPQMLFFLLSSAVHLLSSSYFVRLIGVTLASQVAYNQEYAAIKYMLLAWLKEPSWTFFYDPYSSSFSCLASFLSASQSFIESFNLLVQTSPTQLIKHYFLSPMPVMASAPIQVFYESDQAFSDRTKEHGLYVELHKLALSRWNALSIYTFTVAINAVYFLEKTPLLFPMFDFLKKGMLIQAYWHAGIVWNTLGAPLFAPFLKAFTILQKCYAGICKVLNYHIVSLQDREKSKSLLLRLCSKE